MGETKVQGCEEKEKVLLLWERALTLFYENDTELFVTGAQERTIAGKIAMHMDKIYREIFPMPELVIDIEYNRMDTGIKPKYPGSEDKKKRWTAPDIVLHKRRSINYNIFCCEMKKASKPGQGDARKVKRLVRHINYHFGIDLYKINRTEARFGFHGSETLCNKLSVQLVQIDLPALFSIILLLCNFVDRRGKQIDLIEIFPQADIHKRLL